MGGRNIDPDMMDLARHGETRPCLRRPARGRRLATVRGTPRVRDGHFATCGFNPGSGTVSRPATRTPRPGRPAPLGPPLYTAPARDKVGPLKPDTSTTVEFAGRSGVWRSVVSSGRLWRRP